VSTTIVCGTGDVAAAIARALRDTGHDVVTVSESSAVAHAIASAAERGSRVDALVNAPNVEASAGTILATPEDVWDYVTARDLTATFRACKAALPYFIENGGGSIVNVATSAGYGRAKHLAESAVHGGIIAFGAALAYDHFNDRVRVNTIVTGDAAMPDAIAPVAAFLLSPAADVMSGSLIDVGHAAYQGGR
jgi:NAD(P)-dependent dehydrogenase (short-subunit alcohol dehydrogenase family)